ncbi:MAG: PQQ-binding-like beta-propeller repeat protein [Acidobacteria bacterium]|nr:PQQ-binding-like beta-propeller repeat protein [Acidobacteriota bacterium]
MTKRALSGVFLVAILVAGVADALGTAPEDDWKRFRGPNGSGVVEAGNLPTEFGPDTNVVWKTALPSGFSSPVIADDRVFVTALEGEALETIALDRTTGEILWRQTSPRPRQESVDFRSHPAAASAVVADNELYVFFHDYGLLSYDLDGEERWDVAMGPFTNIYGMGASPVIVDDLVILVADQEVESFIAAYDRATGDEVWRVARPEAHSGHSTPILWVSPEGEQQLLVPGSFLLDAYDPFTGEKLWWVSGLSFEMKSTPVIHDGVAFVNGYGSPMNQPGNQVFLPEFDELMPDADSNGDGLISQEEMPQSRATQWFGLADYEGDGNLNEREWAYLRAALESRNGMLAIRLGGSGDMSEENLIWEYNKAVPQLPSPLIYNDILYMVNDGGIVTSFDPATGEVIAQGRLKGAIDQYYASPIAADGKIFMLSELCMFSVLEPDGGLAPVSVSDLDDLCHATPAIADDRIYLRTRNHLYAFGLTD